MAKPKMTPPTPLAVRIARRYLNAESQAYLLNWFRTAEKTGVARRSRADVRARIRMQSLKPLIRELGWQLHGTPDQLFIFATDEPLEIIVGPG